MMESKDKAATDSVFRLRSFWILSFVPILLGVTSILFTCNSCNDSMGAFFNQWIYWTADPKRTVVLWDLLKVPIGIAFLSLPIAGLIAVNHRSMQTAAQITQAKKQHELASYIEHKRQYNECLDSINEEYGVRFTDREQFYKELFPNNSQLNFTSIKAGSYLAEVGSNTSELYRVAKDLQLTEHGCIDHAFRTYESVNSIDSEEAAKAYIYSRILELVPKILEKFYILNKHTFDNIKSGQSRTYNKALCVYFFAIRDIDNKIRGFCNGEFTESYQSKSLFEIEFPMSVDRMPEKYNIKKKLIEVVR